MSGLILHDLKFKTTLNNLSQELFNALYWFFFGGGEGEKSQDISKVLKFILIHLTLYLRTRRFKKGMVLVFEDFQV
jgi:hypothetical protein